MLLCWYCYLILSILTGIGNNCWYGVHCCSFLVDSLIFTFLVPHVCLVLHSFVRRSLILRSFTFVHCRWVRSAVHVLITSSPLVPSFSPFPISVHVLISFYHVTLRSSFTRFLHLGSGFCTAHLRTHHGSSALTVGYGSHLVWMPHGLLPRHSPHLWVHCTLPLFALHTPGFPHTTDHVLGIPARLDRSRFTVIIDDDQSVLLLLSQWWWLLIRVPDSDIWWYCNSIQGNYCY